MTVGGMELRRLGPEGMLTSPLGLGCMGFSQAYGAADDEESVATVRRALDLGVTMLDTAMSYGAGHNERLLARAMAGRRDAAVVATKFGIIRGEGGGVHVDGRPDRVRGFCEASLQRLEVDHIDLYYQHRVDPSVPIEETVGAMSELVAEGKVAHLGLSEASVDELERAVATHPITALQIEWSLWWREAEDDVVPAARRLGVGLVAYSPLGRGALTGTVSGSFGSDDFRRHDPRFHGDDLDRNLALVGEVRRLAERRGITPAQLALAWLLAQGDDVVPIPGTRRATRVEENAAAVAVRLTPAELAGLEAVVPRGAWVGDRQSFAAHGTTRSAS